MLSSIKPSINPLLLLLLFLWLLIATLLPFSAAYTRRQAAETTTTTSTTEIETVLPLTETTANTIGLVERKTTTTTPIKTTTTTTKATTAALLKSTPTKKSLLLLNNTQSQQKIEDYGKSVKIFFPTPSDSEEESKFDVYGLKTTPLPSTNKVLFGDKSTSASTEATLVTETTTISIKTNNSTTNLTLISVDDRLGILNLAPHCPDGFVVVNQRCHKSA